MPSRCVIPPLFLVLTEDQKEESEVLQNRAALSLAAFVDYCGSPLFATRANPCDKVIKNLFTFLCQDVTITPVFTMSSEGILTLREDKPVPAKKGAAKDEPEESEEQIAARVTRRGALEAFRAMARKFGPELFTAVPKYWEGISMALLSSFGKSQYTLWLRR